MPPAEDTAHPILSRAVNLFPCALERAPTIRPSAARSNRREWNSSITIRVDRACGCEAPCRARNFRAFATAHIRRAELIPSATALTRANDQTIRRALEQAGVEFIDDEKGGPGVRLRTTPEQKMV
jgi:hypothetical protein